jgi:hypothetical protein
MATQPITRQKKLIAPAMFFSSSAAPTGPLGRPPERALAAPAMPILSSAAPAKSRCAPCHPFAVIEGSAAGQSPGQTRSLIRPRTGLVPDPQDQHRRRAQLRSPQPRSVSARHHPGRRFPPAPGSAPSVVKCRTAARAGRPSQNGQ